MDVPGLDKWDPWRPERVAEQLAGCAVPWCIAAGWAIELFVGEPVRPHGDIEIAIPRADFAELRPYLNGYQLWLASGPLVPLGPDEEPPPDRRQIWLCEQAVPAWRMDTFLEPGDRTTWISHRDDRIRRPLAEAIARTPGGIPYLRPEIVLFTKAKRTEAKDERDLAAALPLLDPAAREWLVEALTMVYPDHPWRAVLR